MIHLTMRPECMTLRRRPHIKYKPSAWRERLCEMVERLLCRNVICDQPKRTTRNKDKAVALITMKCGDILLI